MSQRPRAFRLDRPDVVTAEPDQPIEEARGAVVVTLEREEIVDAADGAPVPMGPRLGAPWAGLLLSALGGLLALGIGLAAESLVRDLFAKADWLGWTALALALLALVAFLGILVREASGIRRERQIERLRHDALVAVERRDDAKAKRLAAELVGIYRPRASTARGRARVEAVRDEILEAEDRLIIAERELLVPLDEAAKRVIANAAKQVSVVTAVSPRALIDVAFVVFAGMRLLRQISRIYGGRPGTLGFLRLGRAAIGYLAVTGGVAVGDSLIQQALGLGLAGRISARLGEGVLNGLMTARFGLAAMAVCRPLPFIGEEAPRFSDVAGELLSSAPKETDA